MVARGSLPDDLTAILLGPQLTDWVRHPWPLLDGLRSEAVAIGHQSSGLGVQSLHLQMDTLAEPP